MAVNNSSMAENKFMVEFTVHQSIANKLEDLRINQSIFKLELEDRRRTDEFPNFARETIERCKESNLELKMKITDADNASHATELIMNALCVKNGRTDDSNFAKETMKRYKESNIELYELILKMKITDADSASLATELIMDALNLSVKKLQIIIAYSGKMLVLPGQVFESRSLKLLCATNCIINQPISGSVLCSPFVSLNLTSVSIGDDMMRDILSRCLLIEILVLRDLKDLTKISLGKMHNLKHCYVEYIEYKNENTFVDFFEQGFTQFPNLSSLVFEEVHLESTFFQHFMVKFPCLTELQLYNCYGFEGIVEISSPCLEILRVEGLSETKRSVFNVPNIRTFDCWGETHVPSLYINTSSKEWEFSDLVLWCSKDLPRSWFLRLREFLQNLSVSKEITLYLNFDYSTQGPCTDMLLIEEEDTSGVPCIPVENLAFVNPLGQDKLSPSAISNLVSGLFSTCRPNFITLITFPPRQPSGRDLPVLELLRESVTKHADWKCDLKQVTFELLFVEEDGTLKEWRPILWDDLVSLVSLKVDYDLEIRLKLEWNGGLN